MRLHFKVALGIFIAVSLFFVLRSSPHRARPPLPDLEASPIHTNSSSVDIKQDKVPAVDAKAEVKDASELKTYLLRQHPAAIEARIDERDPWISRYRLLGRKKVLLSSDEAQELAEILRDKGAWSTYQDYLQKVDFSSNAPADEQMYRLFILQYLESSLNQTKDPNLVEFFVNFVLKDNFGEELSVDVKKSLAYEKIKVLNYLRQHNPQSLDAIRQRLSGIRHEKLIRDYFENPPDRGNPSDHGGAE